MCGIAGIYDRYLNTSKLNHHLGVMGKLIEHRGPDDKGKWSHQNGFVGFAHQRLSIIDLSENGSQPMTDNFGNCIKVSAS